MKKGIKELEKKILDRAYEEAEQLVSKTKKARERIIRMAREEAKEIEGEAKRKGEKNFEIEKKRIKSEKAIDERKGILIMHQKIFERLTLDLEEQLFEMLKNNEFNDWIKAKCEEIIRIEKDKMLFVAREEDMDIYKEIVDGIENISLIIEPIGPGFLLRGEKNEYDFRFRLLSQNLIHEHRKMVMSILGE